MRMLFLFLLISLKSLAQISAPSIGVLGSSETLSTTYYVAASGNCGNTGLSSGSPNSANCISGLTLHNGDKILFNKGDTFSFGDFSTSVTSLTLGNYGSGANPKIYGSNSLSAATWTNAGGGIYTTPVASMNWLYHLGTAVGIAQTGNLAFTSVTSNTITLNSAGKTILNAYGSSLVGAKIRGQAHPWEISLEYTVSGYNSSTGVITTSTTHTIGAGGITGFCFLYGQQQFLTANTWYWDGSTTLYYYSTTSPSGTDTRIGVYNTLLTNATSLTMSNVELTQYQLAGITFGANSSVTNNSIHDCRGIGIMPNSANNSTINSNTISNCDLFGISPQGSGYSYGTGCTTNTNVITNIGMGATYGFKTSISFSEGCGIVGLGTVQYNTVTNCAYIAYLMSGGNCSYNQASNYMQVYSDGSAFYCYATANQIFNYNTALEGGNANIASAYGYYIDNNSSGATLDHNTLNSTNGFLTGGLILNSGTKNSTVTNNNLRGSVSNQGLISIIENGGFSFTNSGNIVTNNILVNSASPNESLLYINVGATSPFSSGGSCDYNNYIEPYVSGKTVNYNTTNYSLASWKSVLSTDANSTEWVSFLAPYYSSRAPLEVLMQTNYANSVLPFTPSPAGYVFDQNNSALTTVNIPAYYSQIYFVVMTTLPVSGAVAWYTPQSMTTDGSNWTDIVNGNNLTASGAQKPSFVGNQVNGWPAFQCSQTQWQTGASRQTGLEGISGLTIAAIGKKAYVGYTGSVVYDLLNQSSTFNYAEIYDTGSGLGYGHITVQTSFNKQVMIFDGTQTGNANRLKLYLNGTSQTLSFDTNMGTSTAADASARLANNVSSGLGQYVVEWVIFARALNSTDLTNLQAYWLAKYGL